MNLVTKNYNLMVIILFVSHFSWAKNINLGVSMLDKSKYFTLHSAKNENSSVIATMPIEIGDTITYEAEDATLSGIAEVGMCNASSQGKRVKNIHSGRENAVLFDIPDVPAGIYALAINYFNVIGINMILEVNGRSQVIYLPAAGSCCTQAGVNIVNIKLQAGVNTIKVYNSISLDKIDLTFLTPLLSFEAEDATLSGTAQVTSCSAASQGEQVKTILSGSANAVLFDIPAPIAGTYELALNYFNVNDKEMTLEVNGAGQQIALPASGTWCNSDAQPGVYKVNIPLQAGNNTIKVYNSTTLDKIDLVFLTPFMSFEAENATLSGSAQVTTCNASSQGEHVKTIHSGSANAVLFDVPASLSGTYELSLNYFNAGNMNMTLEVNGAGQQIALPASGSWCNSDAQPGIYKVNIPLQAGDNTIKVYNSTTLDKIDLALLAVTDPAARMAPVALTLEGEKTTGPSESFEVYPNPSHGSFKVFIPATDGVQSAELRAYNYQGKEVKKFTGLPVGMEVRLDLGNVKSGIYILKVMTNPNSSVQTKKIVIDSSSEKQ